MKLLPTLKTATLAYVLVQVTVGIQVGVAVAHGHLIGGHDPLVLSAILGPAGYGLLLIQYPLAYSVFNNSNSSSKV